jgi:hypothetical protein
MVRGEMVRREWQRIRLCGGHWWNGTAFPVDRDREDARASAAREDSEAKLSKLLEDGWEIVSVVADPPSVLFRSRAGSLMQETFSVFLQRQIDEPLDGGAHPDFP